MSVSITQRRIDEVIILDLAGRWTIGNGARVLWKERIEKLLDSADRKFLLSLSDVDYIDSSGLGVMVLCFTKIKNCDGLPKPLELKLRVRGLLQITKPLAVFETFDNETEALKSFQS